MGYLALFSRLGNFIWDNFLFNMQWSAFDIGYEKM